MPVLDSFAARASDVYSYVMDHRYRQMHSIEPMQPTHSKFSCVSFFTTAIVVHHFLKHQCHPLLRVINDIE